MSEPRISLEAALAELRTLGGEAALLDETRCRAILADRLPDERARIAAAVTALRVGVVERLRAAPPAMGREAVLREAALLTQDYAVTSALALEAAQAWARVFGLETGAANASGHRDLWAQIKGLLPAGLEIPAALKNRTVQAVLAAGAALAVFWGPLTQGGGTYTAFGVSEKQDLALSPKGLIEAAIQAKGIDFIAAKANSKNHAGEALYCFAYYFGLAVQEDNEWARIWCERAAIGKNGLGHLGLYLLYSNGYGVQVDKAKAKSELMAGAEADDPRAQFWLASLYLNGDDLTAVNDQAALPLIKDLAQRGHLGSRFYWGWMYENGRGVEKDLAEALRRYRELEQENIPAGIRGVAWMIYNGWGGASQSYTEAAALYQRASDLGDGNASNNLAGMYERGEGVPQSREEAVRLYRLAIQQGYDSAANLRALGYSP